MFLPTDSVDVQPDAGLVSAQTPGESRRAERFAARHTLWDETTLKRVRNCGRAVQSKGAGVSVRVSDVEGRRVAGYSGVQSCGSVWACPVCSAKVAAHRQHEITRACQEWIDRGGRIAMGSFTMRHHKGHALRTLWDALAKGWHAAASGRGWAEDQLSHGTLEAVETKKGLTLRGRIPWVRVTEGTVGDAGWHMHVHTLLFLPANATDESVAVLEDRMWDRWSAGLSAAGMTALRSVGAKIQLLQGDPADAMGEYFVKATYSAAQTAGLEAARGDLKSARGGNRTPFAVLADVVTDGDADDLDTWHEWERGSKGRRQIAWSRGLRAELLTDEEELTDEEVAEQEHDGDRVADIDADVWRCIVANRADWQLLGAFQRSEAEGRRLLAEYMMKAELAALDELRAAAPAQTIRHRHR